MLNAPVALFLNISAGVLRRSISITASDTLDSGMSTRVSATIAADPACPESPSPPDAPAKIVYAAFSMKGSLSASSTLWSFRRLV